MKTALFMMIFLISLLTEIQIAQAYTQPPNAHCVKDNHGCMVACSATTTTNTKSIMCQNQCRRNLRCPEIPLR